MLANKLEGMLFMDLASILYMLVGFIHEKMCCTDKP